MSIETSEEFKAFAREHDLPLKIVETRSGNRVYLNMETQLASDAWRAAKGLPAPAWGEEYVRMVAEHTVKRLRQDLDDSRES